MVMHPSHVMQATQDEPELSPGARPGYIGQPVTGPVIGTPEAKPMSTPIPPSRCIPDQSSNKLKPRILSIKGADSKPPNTLPNKQSIILPSRCIPDQSSLSSTTGGGPYYRSMQQPAPSIVMDIISIKSHTKKISLHPAPLTYKEG